MDDKFQKVAAAAGMTVRYELTRRWRVLHGFRVRTMILVVSNTDVSVLQRTMDRCARLAGWTPRRWYHVHRWFE